MLRDIVVARSNGSSVVLGDIAEIVAGPAPKFGDTLIQGQDGVLMTMSSQYGANTLEVTRLLEAVLRDMQPVLDKEGIRLYSRLHRPATFIESALGNIRHSLVLGGVLVAVVLLLLLGSIRTACISLAAIPISLLAAIIGLEAMGVTINTITLGGLAIALGEVVDDSIIDVENIFRRLRENRLMAQPRPVMNVILQASLEVRRVVVFATLIVVLVFLPVLLLTGLQGSFFSPLAQSYILAILASLLVALTLTPALAYILFQRGASRSAEPRLQRWLKAMYGSLLRLVMRRPRAIIAAAASGCMAAVGFIPQVGEFLPSFREGHFVLQVFAAPGTSLPEMKRVGKRISDQLLADTSHIATVEQQIGRAELGEDPWGPNRSEFHVDLQPMPAKEEALMADQIREVLGQFPGMQYEVLTFLGDRIGETISGETAPVVVNLFGDNLDILDQKAREVSSVIGSVEGAVDVQVKSPPGEPRIVVRLRQDRLKQWGFRPVEVMGALETSYQGTTVAQVQEGNRVVDVVVVLPPENRRDPEAVGSLQLRNSEGLLLPLHQLADVFLSTGRHSILHEGARRRQTVTCATSGRDVASFVAAARQEVAARVRLPKGTYIEFGGAAEAEKAAQQQLTLHVVIAAVGVLMLLAIVLHDWRNLLLVMANVPFALVGGVLAVRLAGHFVPDGGLLTLGSLVGFVTLFGITMRNSIMMISHFEHLVQEEHVPWGLECVLRGASERFMPIVMTAAVTGLGLLPLAWGSGEAGREIEGPMAVVILGGLMTSTLLNLLILPTLALRFGRFESVPE
jgi:CzcA family heavy metal efflux pump